MPGDHDLYDFKPPKVDYYDVFYFETRMREMVEEHLEQYRASNIEDKKIQVQLRHDYDTILERLHELESYALLQEWKIKPAKQFQALFQNEEDIKKIPIVPNKIAPKAKS